MTSIGYFGPHTVLALVFRGECHYKFRIDPLMDLLWEETQKVSANQQETKSWKVTMCFSI